MKTVSAIAICIIALVVLLTPSLFAQHLLHRLHSTTTQADYVIIAPPNYLSTMEPLAAHRSARNGFRVILVTSDSIYSQFGQGVAPDSAIKLFIAFALTSWEDPKPQYFLLAGNVNAIPSHKEPGLVVPPDILEDSVMIDQWFVEGVPGSAHAVPAAALGRFPAWDQTQLQTMVTKTINYENSVGDGWMYQSIAAADYDPPSGFLFEIAARSQQGTLSNLWDTISVHVREDSPLHLDRIGFRNLWNQGAAIISFVGHVNSVQFSHQGYFTTWDVDSLTNADRLPFCFLDGSQRFQNQDTVAIAVNLMQTSSRGAVGAFAPAGLVYFYQCEYLLTAIFQQMIANPRRAIGTSVLIVKRLQAPSLTHRKFTLLADPALVIKNPVVANVVPPGEIPGTYLLHQNYPNPFNPETRISFDLPKSSSVTLKVFNLIGQEVASVVNGRLEAGKYTYVVGGTHLSSGVYFYRLQADGFVQTRKMIITK